VTPTSPGSEPGPPSGHLVLVGMMASGKTTVGRAVAERTGRRFVDSDEQVEAHAGRTVRAIFAEQGEAAFRTLETEALRAALADPRPAVVAAAGGVVLSQANRELLQGCGHPVVWLRAGAGVLAARVRRSGQDHRPLLADDPDGTLRRLADDRAELYAEVATRIVDVDDRPVADIVEEVLT